MRSEAADMTTHPATWHPDPTGRHQLRYWDGSVWTDTVANGGIMAIDPVALRPWQTMSHVEQPKGLRPSAHDGPKGTQLIAGVIALLLLVGVAGAAATGPKSRVSEVPLTVTAGAAGAA